MFDLEDLINQVALLGSVSVRLVDGDAINEVYHGDDGIASDIDEKYLYMPIWSIYSEPDATVIEVGNDD